MKYPQPVISLPVQQPNAEEGMSKLQYSVWSVQERICAGEWACQKGIRRLQGEEKEHVQTFPLTKPQRGERSESCLRKRSSLGAEVGFGVQPAMSKASLAWSVRAGSCGKPLAETWEEESTATRMAKMENILRRLQALRTRNIVRAVIQILESVNESSECDLAMQAQAVGSGMYPRHPSAQR